MTEWPAVTLGDLCELKRGYDLPTAQRRPGPGPDMSVARVLLHDPKLLIFDEPLSGLDVVSARLFKDLLEALAAQGKAILYISHVLEVVELICNRVIVIAKGRILADAPPSELMTSLHLTNLESVFAQLVQHQDTQGVARDLVQIMAVHHA